jgi:hypothetical protein
MPNIVTGVMTVYENVPRNSVSYQPAGAECQNVAVKVYAPSTTHFRSYHYTVIPLRPDMLATTSFRTTDTYTKYRSPLSRWSRCISLGRQLPFLVSVATIKLHQSQFEHGLGRVFAVFSGHEIASIWPMLLCFWSFLWDLVAVFERRMELLVFLSPKVHLCPFALWVVRCISHSLLKWWLGCAESAWMK